MKPVFTLQDFRWFDISSKKIHPGLSLQCKKKTSDIKELVHLKGEDYTLSSVREREHVWFNELFKQEKSCCLIRIK